jgi:hypothetical protein
MTPSYLLVSSKTPTSTPKKNPFTFVGLAYPKKAKDIVVFRFHYRVFIVAEGIFIGP